jgi:hypothetical protein
VYVASESVRRASTLAHEVVMAGYGLAQKKSERAPTQHRPHVPLCGICGSETDGGLLCNPCVNDCNDERVRVNSFAKIQQERQQ